MSSAVTGALAKPARGRPFITIKDVMWLLYLYPLRLFVRALPLSLARLSTALTVSVSQLLFSRSRRRVEKLMAVRLASRVPAEEVPEIARRFMANVVQRLFDDMILGRLVTSGQLVPAELSGLEHLEAALRAGKGAMIVNGHFFGNRLAKRYLAEVGYPMLSVRNGVPPDKRMGRLGEQYLQRRYVEFLHGVIREEVLIQDPELSLKIFRRLRAGGLVHVYMDASFSPERTCLPFLDNPAAIFPTGFLRIARLSGCAVLPMLCLGDSRRLTIRFEPPVTFDEADSAQEFAVRNLPPLIRKLEAEIVRYPDQWDAWKRTL